MTETQSIFSNRCWWNGQLQPATICYHKGKITETFPYKTADAIDVGDCIIMPGAIDAHVHVNEPGRTEWEGFDSATKAAAAGGITTIIDMPLNASPVTTTLQSFQQKLAATAGKMHVNVGFYGGLVPNNINDLEDLIKAGVLGIKCFLVHSGIDEFPNVGAIEMDQAMPIIAKYKIPLLAHCEIDESKAPQDLTNNPTSYQAYLASRPKQWENDAVDLMIQLCAKHKSPVHIVHVSSAEALPAIAKAKADGLMLTAETCPHYLLFEAETIPDANTLFKCAPPIREQANNQLLKNALANGILNFIATDHSPAPSSIKEIESGNLQKAWGGIAGLQFLLSASWTALKNQMTIEQFIPLLTENPAKFLKVDDIKGKIAVGYDADLVIWNPFNSFEVKTSAIFHKHQLSPYCNKVLFGEVFQTIVNGATVYQDKKIIHLKKGQWLLHQ
jgi:allantoinase